MTTFVMLLTAYPLRVCTAHAGVYLEYSWIRCVLPAGPLMKMTITISYGYHVAVRITLIAISKTVHALLTAKAKEGSFVADNIARATSS